MQPLGAQEAHERHQVIDVVLQPKAARCERHLTRIDPVGDVDVVVGRKGTHGVTQERCEVAREGRAEQHLGLRIEARARGLRLCPAHEAHELTEGRRDHDLFGDREALAFKLDLRDVEGRSRVFLRQPMDKLPARSGRLGTWQGRVAENLGRGARPESHRLERPTREIMEFVEHCVEASVASLMLQCNNSIPP